MEPDPVGLAPGHPDWDRRRRQYSPSSVENRISESGAGVMNRTMADTHKGRSNPAAAATV